MKKSKNNKRSFKNKTLVADTKEDEVSNRVTYEKESYDISEEEEVEDKGYSSGDEQDIEPVELTRKNFDIKLTMIVILYDIEL